MSHITFPSDGTPKSLIADETIEFLPETMDAGTIITFEVQFFGVTALDDAVVFKFFSGLSFTGLDAPNVIESIESIDLTGLSGDLTFLREFIHISHDHFRIKVSGTNAGSTATCLILGESSS